MIVKYYEFLSKIPGEVTEVEVDEELGKYIAEMDEAAAKIDRKETRRHTYMSELEEKGRYSYAEKLFHRYAPVQIGNKSRRKGTVLRSGNA